VKLNKKQLAREIDAYVRLRNRAAKIVLDMARHSQMIRRAGGGESAKWVAKLVSMPRKVVIVKAHKQLRVVAK
jgi:phage anti-repressor protein